VIPTFDEDARPGTACREFISEEWLGFLSDREVPFVIRMRSSRKVALSAPGKEAALPARMFFREPPASVRGPEAPTRRRKATVGRSAACSATGWTYGVRSRLNLAEKKGRFRRCVGLLQGDPPKSFVA